MLPTQSERLDADGRRDADETEHTCPNDDPYCPGPDGDELPCFPCFAERGEGAGR
jgi:hypothetical protein